MRYSPERLYRYSTRVFGTARVDLNRPMSFRLLFRSLHFLALVFATISLVCFGVQGKIVGKNSCFGVSVFRCSGVSLFRGLVMPQFSATWTECYGESSASSRSGQKIRLEIQFH